MTKQSSANQVSTKQALVHSRRPLGSARFDVYGPSSMFRCIRIKHLNHNVLKLSRLNFPHNFVQWVAKCIIPLYVKNFTKCALFLGLALANIV
jgi:hypothetical protein